MMIDRAVWSRRVMNGLVCVGVAGALAKVALGYQVPTEPVEPVHPKALDAHALLDLDGRVDVQGSMTGPNGPARLEQAEYRRQ